MATESQGQSRPTPLSDTEKIAAIRAGLPVTGRYLYFNAGTNGPLPRRSHDALIANSERELNEGRISSAAFTRLLQNLDDSRAAVATVLSTACAASRSDRVSSSCDQTVSRWYSHSA